MILLDVLEDSHEAKPTSDGLILAITEEPDKEDLAIPAEIMLVKSFPLWLCDLYKSLIPNKSD